ncbi:transposase [uncultured Kriegella sp.]|uniref:transposase n=1 Tax=uncultured Kriegella sp. TaxID=1798910 RepID=UPI0030D9861C
MGLRKINTIGLEQGNKCMQLSVIAYNIKEYLKFIEKRSKSGAGQLGLMAFVENTIEYVFGTLTKHEKLTFHF